MQQQPALQTSFGAAAQPASLQTTLQAPAPLANGMTAPADAAQAQTNGGSSAPQLPASSGPNPGMGGAASTEAGAEPAGSVAPASSTAPAAPPTKGGALLAAGRCPNHEGGSAPATPGARNGGGKLSVGAATAQAKAAAAQPPAKPCSSAAAAAQQRHADLARRAAEAAVAQSSSGNKAASGSAQLPQRSSGGNGATDGSESRAHSKGGRFRPPRLAEEAERRAKRRRVHKAEVARWRRTELRRRVADITAEYEALQNEVHHIRALWAEPPPPLEAPLTDADRSQVAANAARRIADLMARPCASVLKTVMSHKWAYPFNEPVDTKRYDNYLTYVTRPMDFGTIKRQLEAGHYREPTALLADVRQVFTNAFLFNPKESNVAVMATFLQEKFEDRWQASVANRLIDAAAATRAEETAAVRAADEAAQSARTEGLISRAEALTAALDSLGHRLADAQSLAAAQCESVSLQDKDELARAIGGLGQEAFGAAMGLLVGRAPELHPGACDMIVDMDRLDALTLRQLQHFVATADDAAAAYGSNGGVGGGAAAGPGGGGEAAPAAEAPIVWPGLLAGNGLRGYRLPSFRGGHAPELPSADSADRPPSGAGPAGASVAAGPSASAAAGPYASAAAGPSASAPSAQTGGAEQRQPQQQQQHKQQQPQQQLQPQPQQQQRQAAGAATERLDAGGGAGAGGAGAGAGQPAADASQQAGMAAADQVAPPKTLAPAPGARLDDRLSTQNSGALNMGGHIDATRHAADFGAAMLHEDGSPQARHLQHQDSSASPQEAGATAAQHQQHLQQQQHPALAALLPQPAALPMLQPPAAVGPPDLFGLAPSLRPRTLQDALRDSTGGPGGSLRAHEAPPCVAAAVAAAALPVAANALVEGAQTATAMVE